MAIIQRFHSLTLFGRFLPVFATGAYALIASFAGVFSLPVLDRDEARFAQATVQMLETGDFLNIRFQEQERNRKPGGAYWAQAASVSAFSTPHARDIWAFRLPSVGAAVAATLFTYAIGSTLFSRQTGVLAGFMLASAPGFLSEATIAKTDALLVAAVCGAMASLAQIQKARIEGQSLSPWWAASFWVALSIGALVKGPIAPFVGIAAAVLINIGTPWRVAWRDLRPGLGVLAFGLLVGPWFLAINAATEGRFFAEAVGQDMLGKIGAPQERHGGPIGYHLALAPLLLWPATGAIPAAITGAVKFWRERRIGFLIAWLIPGWVLFELTATKLPHYTLPLYPALCLLAAEATRRGLGSHPVAAKSGAVLYLLSGLMIAGLLAALSFYAGSASQRMPFFLAALTLIATTLAITRAYLRGQTQKALVAACFASSAIVWVTFAGLATQLDQLDVSRRIQSTLIAHGIHPLRNGALPAVIAGYHEPSIVFMLGTQTRLADGATAAKLAIGSEVGAAIIEAREGEAFAAHIKASREAGGAPPIDVIGAVSGVNYSTGKGVEVVIYRIGAVPGSAAPERP